MERQRRWWSAISEPETSAEKGCLINAPLTTRLSQPWGTPPPHLPGLVWAFMIPSSFFFFLFFFLQTDRSHPRSCCIGFFNLTQCAWLIASFCHCLCLWHGLVGIHIITSVCVCFFILAVHVYSSASVHCFNGIACFAHFLLFAGLTSNCGLQYNVFWNQIVKIQYTVYKQYTVL